MSQNRSPRARHFSAGLSFKKYVDRCKSISCCFTSLLYIYNWGISLCNRIHTKYMYPHIYLHAFFKNHMFAYCKNKFIKYWNLFTYLFQLQIAEFITSILTLFVAQPLEISNFRLLYSISGWKYQTQDAKLIKGLLRFLVDFRLTEHIFNNHQTSTIKWIFHEHAHFFVFYVSYMLSVVPYVYELLKQTDNIPKRINCSFVSLCYYNFSTCWLDRSFKWATCFESLSIYVEGSVLRVVNKDYV